MNNLTNLLSYDSINSNFQSVFDNLSHPSDDDYEEDDFEINDFEDLPLGDNMLDIEELTIIDAEYFTDDFATENLNMVSSHVDQNGVPCSGFGSRYNGFLSGKILENSMAQIGQPCESAKQMAIRFFGTM